MTEIQNHKSG